MKEEKKESPIGVLWGWGKPYHGKFIGSIILAVLGVACQMVPYFCVAHIVTMMLSGEQTFSRYVTAGIIALCGYLGKVLFSCLSTTISHTATYYTLRDLRENITAKLVRIPMGTILDTPSGQYKTTIVDRVEGMEPTFAHLIPEMTANVLVPIVIAVYLFLLDWRMALLSLVTLVVGLAVMSAGMKNYPVKWEGAVKAGKLMANAIVEYIGGIEVVKAFSQSAGSYKKYSDAVNYNANYYVDWMRENQKTMRAYNAILPSVLICVLPCGFAFWLSGSLELSTFLSIVIFSLGLVGPIIAAFTFTEYDIWAEVKPRIVEAFGKVIDAAILFGEQKPSSWREGIVKTATTAGSVVTLGANDNLYDKIMTEDGVIAKVEDCGYFVNGHMADISMRAKLRGLKDSNGNPIFKSDLQGTTQYALDGSPMTFPNNGAFDKSKALMISGDFSQLAYAIRQDITFKLFTEGVVQNTDGTIAYNLMQNDMVALRAVMRLGWEIPNPINALKSDKAKRCPFAVLKAGE